MKSCRSASLILLLWIGQESALVQAEPLGCLIEPSEVADVGSEVIGILEKLHVGRGDLITKGQPAAELDAKVERAALAAAEARAMAYSELKAAESNFQFAKRKRDRTQDLFAKKFVSEQVNDQAHTESKVAELRYQQAKEQQDIAKRELLFARAQLARRTIKSPITGVVVERYLSPGERVEQKPLLRVANIDPLHVEVFVSAAQFNTVQPGSTPLVRPEIPGSTDRRAKVIQVDRVIDPASNTFRVKLEMPNAGHALPSGVRCKVDFSGNGFDAAGPPGTLPAKSTPVPVARKK